MDHEKMKHQDYDNYKKAKAILPKSKKSHKRRHPLKTIHLDCVIFGKIKCLIQILVYQFGKFYQINNSSLANYQIGRVHLASAILS
jgi:hypothetical protein